MWKQKSDLYGVFRKISYVSETVQEGYDTEREFDSDLSGMWTEAADFKYSKRWKNHNSMQMLAAWRNPSQNHPKKKGADMIYTIEQIKDKCRKVFDKQNFIKEAYLFGSYARGEATEKSDIDFMIVLNRTVGLEFFGLYHFLQEEFGKNVDVISEKEAYEIMPKSIERDKVKVY